MNVGNTKYLSIYQELTKKIAHGIYRPNDKLPSENTLITTYGVSRDTIRKALTLLEQNGYIQKTQGKGSFVLDINQFNFPVSGIVSFKELTLSTAIPFTTTVQSIENVHSSQYPCFNAKLPHTQNVWQVTRTRALNNEQIILDKDLLIETIVPGLTPAIAEDSLYTYIEDVLGLKIAYAQKEITAQMATAEDYTYLDMEDFNMVIVVKSYTYLDDTRLFQYTESRHRPDKFVFVDFARR